LKQIYDLEKGLGDVMPTNKPMKNQWIEVDGRLIPVTLPQHWSGNDWAITGTDNPLPVANYTKKGNLWLPTSEDNPVPTQVTGSNVEQLKSRRESTKFAYRDGILPLNAEETVAEVTNECVIHSITASFEEDNPLYGYLRLSFWNGTGWEMYRVFERPDRERGGITPSRGTNNGLWINISSNGDGNGYVMTWRRELQVRGFRLEVINPGAEDDEKSIAVSVLYSEVQ